MGIRKGSIFKRLFLSYIIMCCIPLIIFGGIFYYYNVIGYQKELSDSNLSKLVQVKIAVDLDLKAFKDMAYHMTSNPGLVENMTFIREDENTEIVSQLQAYKENSSSANEILFYLRGDEFIYSTQGKFHYSVFIENYKKSLNWTNASFFKDINEITAPKTINIKNTEDYLKDEDDILAFMFPIPIMNTLPKGTLICTMGKSSVLSKFENFLGDFQGYVFIYDNYYNPLISYGKDNFINNRSEFEKLLIRTKGTGVTENVRFENKDLVVMRSVSEDNGWSYIVAMPSSEFYARVKSMKNILYVLVAVITMIGLAIALYISVKSYKPIRLILSYIKNEEKQITDIRGKDEIEMIRFSVENNIKKNKDLINQIDTQRSLIKDQCLIKIIRGKVNDERELDYLIKCSNIQLKGIMHFVTVLSINNGAASTESTDKVLKLVEDMHFNNYRAYGVELVQEKLIAILVSMNDYKDLEDDQLMIVNDINELVVKNIGLKTTFGVGNAYGKILQLNASFLEASAVLYDNFMNTKTNIHFFSNIEESHKQVLWFPVKEQALLLQSLKQGDKTVAVETINLITENIAKYNTSYMMLRYICFDIVNNIIKTANQMNVEMLPEDIKKLDEFLNLEDFMDKIKVLVIKLCEHFEKLKESRNSEMKNNIIDYVNNHFKDSNICLENVASESDISTTYLSRFFKDKTGVNFIEYITNLRMDDAKTQLRTNSKSIKDIVQDIGYIDTASFTRKFKSIEGITPGQYRSMYSSNK